MALSTSCLDRARLRDLLDGALPDDEQAELTRHLDTCASCQQKLEALAAGEGSWPGTTPWPGHEPAGLESALRQAMSVLKGDTADLLDTFPDNDDNPRALLTPSEYPGSLGRFGPYEVLEVLGKGGMGVVFKAFDPALHRLVAVKVLAPQLATSAAARKRFGREARAAAAVSHDHVVAIHGVEEANGLPYLVMQYVPGVSLQQRLDRDGRLPLEEVLRIGIQAAEGLAAAHAQGLIHRDVKPANILLEALPGEPGASAPGGGEPGPSAYFRVKITDFSLARAIDDASMTQSGFLAGTPQYMAPEQARGEAVDHRADLFSLGSVLYALCTGRPPFQARTTLAVLRRVSDETPRPVREINPNVPDCLVEIMNRLHAKDPAQRYQSAAEVAHLLRGCLVRLEHPSPPEEREAPEPRRPRPRRKLLLAATLVLLLGALAATVLRIRTPEGTLVIEVSDPNVHVTVDGKEVVITGAGLAELRLRAGEHRLKATREGRTVRDEVVAITRDKKEIVKVTWEPGQGGTAAAPAARKPLVVLRHTGAVRAVVFSPDGTRLATGGDDRTVHIFDTSTGRELLVLRVEPGRIVSMTFSPEGKTLAVLSEDGTLTWWELATGKERGQLKVRGQPQGGSLQPAGRALATTTPDGVVQIWDVITGKRLAQSLGHSGKVWQLAFSSDGRKLVTGSQDGTVRVWDAATGKALVEPLQNNGPVRSVAFSPDGKVLASSSGDGTVRLWEATTGKEVRAFRTVQLWTDVTTGKEYRVGLNQADSIEIMFSPDGRRLASAAGTTVKVWDLTTGKVLATLDNPGGTITRLVFSPDGRRLAVANSEGTVRLWDVEPESSTRGPEGGTAAAPTARKPFVLTGHTGAVRAVAFSRYGMLATGGDDRTVRIRNTDGKDLVLKGHPGRIVAMSFFPANWWNGMPEDNSPFRSTALPPDTLAVLSEDGTLKLWDSYTGKELQALKVGAQVQGGSFWPGGGGVLATANKDGVVRIWDVATGNGKLLAQSRGHSGKVWQLAFSPDRRKLVTGSQDGTVRIWDPLTGKALVEPLQHHGPVRSVAFSPHGNVLASFGGDGTVRLWDATTGKELRAFREQAEGVDVMFSPDGRRLASAAGTTVKVWDVISGKVVATLDNPGGTITRLVFSPNGVLAVANSEGTVQLWSME